MICKRSPYITRTNRLADVIAAIQVMGTYKVYKLTFEDWADRISGDRNQALHWRNVFEEHPEFFRLDSKRLCASLVWRRQHQKSWSIDRQATLSKDEILGLNGDFTRISRIPLGSDVIAKLMETAINLHARALEQSSDRRWWIPTVAAFIGAVLGSVVSLISAK